MKKYRSAKEHIDRLYRMLKRLQPAIALRCSLNYSDSPGDWLVLLAEVEACFLTLSKLYDAYEVLEKKDELLRLEYPGIDQLSLSLICDEQSEAIDPLIKEALAQWGATYAKYMRMLASNRVTVKKAA